MKTNKRAAVILLALWFLLISATPAFAVSTRRYHPPALMILVNNAPRDLEIRVSMVKEEKRFETTMDMERRVWESYYRLYRDGVVQMNSWYGNRYDFQDAFLILSTGGTERTVPLPVDELTEGGQFDLLSLDPYNGTITYGVSPLRAPLLLILRVAVAFLVEALIFHLFRYRDRRSWIVFCLCNLVTEVGHNLILSGKFVSDENFVGYFQIYLFLIPLVFLVELLAIVAFVDEHNRDYSVSYVLTSNVVSILLQLFALLFLPV